MKWFVGLIFTCFMIISANAANESGYVNRIMCEFPAFKVVMFNTDSLVETRFYQQKLTDHEGDVFNIPSDGIFWIMTNPERGIMQLKRNTDGAVISFAGLRFVPEHFGVSSTRASAAISDRIKMGNCVIVFVTRMD